MSNKTYKALSMVEQIELQQRVAELELNNTRRCELGLSTNDLWDAWEELAALKESQQKVAAKVASDAQAGQGKWDEKRMDIIGQNGNTGEHYAED